MTSDRGGSSSIKVGRVSSSRAAAIDDFYRQKKSVTVTGGLVLIELMSPVLASALARLMA